jgi:hypothetical protein
MTTEKTWAAVRHELRALSDHGATLAELLDHLGQQNRRLGSSSFSDDQEEELELYCWALHKCRSNGLVLGATGVWGTLEDDIGA